MIRGVFRPVSESPPARSQPTPQPRAPSPPHRRSLRSNAPPARAGTTSSAASHNSDVPAAPPRSRLLAHRSRRARPAPAGIPANPAPSPAHSVASSPRVSSTSPAANIAAQRCIQLGHRQTSSRRPRRIQPDPQQPKPCQRIARHFLASRRTSTSACAPPRKPRSRESASPYRSRECAPPIAASSRFNTRCSHSLPRFSALARSRARKSSLPRRPSKQPLRQRAQIEPRSAGHDRKLVLARQSPAAPPAPACCIRPR